MYEFINGTISGLTPAGVVIETGGIGYFLHISVNTYSRINGNENSKLFLHEVVREDAHLLYGFADYLTLPQLDSNLTIYSILRNHFYLYF